MVNTERKETIADPRVEQTAQLEIESTVTPMAQTTYPSPHDYIHKSPVLHRYSTRSKTEKANTRTIKGAQKSA